MAEPVLRVVEGHFGAAAGANVVHRQQRERADANAKQRRVANGPRGCRSVGIAVPERHQDTGRSPGARTVNACPQPLQRPDRRQRQHREQRNRRRRGRADQHCRSASRCRQSSAAPPRPGRTRRRRVPPAGRSATRMPTRRRTSAGAPAPAAIARRRPCHAARQRDESGHPAGGDHAGHVRVEHRPRRTAEQRPTAGAPERQIDERLIPAERTAQRGADPERQRHETDEPLRCGLPRTVRRGSRTTTARAGA